jgi:chromosome partitioning protein
MRRIAFINEKGGTCKTTLAVSTAAWLARERNCRVLLIDLDTQGHASKSLGIDVRTLKRSVFDFLVEPNVGFAELMKGSVLPRLHVLPASKALADFPVRVANDPDRERRLEHRLAPIKGYDYMIIDSPPSMGLMNVNILLAAEEVVIPVALTYFALDGCAEILDTVKRLSETHARPQLRVTHVVPALYRKTALADAILEKLRSRFPETISPTVLGYNVDIDEAQSHGKTIWEYAPKSRGAAMLSAIAQEIAGDAPAKAEAPIEESGGERPAVM